MAQVLWRGTCRSLVLVWFLIAVFTFAFGAIVIANAYTSDPAKRIEGLGWAGPIAVLALGFTVALWSSRAAVEVDEREFRVRFGPGVPSKRIPWSRVASVELCDVRPSRYGGWGYRVRPLKRTSALVLRAGEGLKVTLDNGRVFIVTVDDAMYGLAVIRGILAGR